MQQLGKAIRAARLARGLTQAELGRRFGISKAAVALWESGTNLPDPRRLGELARVLGLDLRVVLGGERERDAASGRVGMTDVVDRVRQYVEMVEAGEVVPSALRPLVAADLREAVAEIERLRARLDELEKE